MFKKLFGKNEPKIDPAQQKLIEQKKNQFEIKQTKETIERKIDENQNKMEGMERQIREKTRVS